MGLCKNAIMCLLYYAYFNFTSEDIIDIDVEHSKSCLGGSAFNYVIEA